jgi:hypothetical protein
VRLWVISFLSLGLLVGCSDAETTKETIKVEDNEMEEVVVEEETSEPHEETTDTTPVDEEEKVASIDTSVFAYAESVDVTDARDITKHIDLVVNMSTEPTPGLAVQHVVSQTYRFLQQEDIIGADTITIGVMQDGTRTAQYTVEVSKFIPVPDKSMVKCVLEASTIDKMNDEVKEFGAVMEMW